jgi:hypothetical protein
MNEAVEQDWIGAMPPVHPACAAYPLTSGNSYDLTRDGIKKCGQLVPCEIWNGFLMDGRNRWKACEELGIKVRVRVRGGTEEEAIQRVLSLSESRKHLSKSQLAVCAELLIPLLEAAKAKDKSRKCSEAGEKHGPRKDSSDSGKVTQTFVPPDSRTEHKNAHSAAAEVAEKFGINRAYVSEVKRLKRDAPDLVPRIASGELTVSAASREAKIRITPEHAQEAPVDAAELAMRKSDPSPPGPENSQSSLYRAKLAWMTIAKNRRNPFVERYAELPEPDRKKFWKFAEKKAELHE